MRQRIQKEILQKADTFLQSQLMKPADYQDNIPRMAEYRIEHSYRVAYIGREIAEKEGFDTERTFIACLLHDVGYAVDFIDQDDHRNHGRYGAEIARPFLRELGYSYEEVQEMCYGIAIHVDDSADFEWERTPLALTVQDADNIDRFDACRLYELLQQDDYMNLSLSDQHEYTVKRLKKLNSLRTLPCGTKTAELLWREKIDYQIGFYERLKKQIENSFLHGTE